MGLKELGAVLFFGSIGIFTLYLLFIFIPQIQSNPTNQNSLMNAVIFGLVAGIIGALGATFAKSDH